MTAVELVNGSMVYLTFFAPFLLVFFALMFADRFINLIFYAIDKFKSRRGW